MSSNSHGSVSLAYAQDYENSGGIYAPYPHPSQSEAGQRQYQSFVGPDTSSQPQYHSIQQQSSSQEPRSDSRSGYFDSPQMLPRRYRTATGTGESRSAYGPDPAGKGYWDGQPQQGGVGRAQTAGPSLGSNAPIYQQSNTSAPALDPNVASSSSRGPPLADEVGLDFDKMSLNSRSKSPDPSSGPAASARGGAIGKSAVERANAQYANQEIFQSASEIQPENSLAAIAQEIDQTAAELRANTITPSPQAQQHQHLQQQQQQQQQHQHLQQQQQQQQHQHHHHHPSHGPVGLPPHSDLSSPRASYTAEGGVGGYPYDQEWYDADGGGNGQQHHFDHGGASNQSYGPYGGYPAQGAPPHHIGGHFSGPPYDPNPYMAAAQGYGLDYPGAPASFGPGYPPDTVARNPSMGMSPSVAAIGNLARQGTQMSMASVHSTGSAAARRKSKDSAPQQTLPFTKEFVAEYRARMKGDPDPEAQFAYARYLIEAAKNIQGLKDGSKTQRKFRDSLLSESLKLIKRLATTGMGLGKPPYAEAQFFLANCFGNGALGLQVDHEKAYNLYVQASKQNHPAATYRTAVCNEVGAGTRRDHHRAVLFYRKASALGDTAGMYKLGMILLNGLLGQPRNVREAIVWLKRAAGQADEDNPHALHELGLLYERANSNVVPQDEAQARELFTQAAQLGYPPSQFKLGSAYEYGSLTCPVDPRRSIAWYTKAARKQDGESELALSGWYLTGSEGVLKQSDSEAFLWANRAATKGIPKAEYAVGYYCEVGIGVEPNLDEAKRWYMRAAAQGNKRAMARLTELKQQKGVKLSKKGAGARPTRKDAEKECIIS